VNFGLVRWYEGTMTWHEAYGQTGWPTLGCVAMSASVRRPPVSTPVRRGSVAELALPTAASAAQGSALPRSSVAPPPGAVRHAAPEVRPHLVTREELETLVKEVRRHRQSQPCADTARSSRAPIRRRCSRPWARESSCQTSSPLGRETSW